MEKRFWLMKSEPGCFSFTDLCGLPGQTSPWDGVRNYQARNLLRDEVQVGDGVLFYHSNIVQPAIVGLARVVRAGYPDYTALDARSEHFDPKATPAKPIWFMVDVQAIAALPAPLTRDDLARHPLLCSMDVLKKGNRLSVQPVSAEQFAAVLQVAGLEAAFTDRRG